MYMGPYLGIRIYVIWGHINGKSGFGELSNANDEWKTYGVRFMWYPQLNLHPELLAIANVLEIL